MMSRVLLVVALALAASTALALPLHEADTALLQKDPTPAPAPVPNSPHCAAAGGACINTAAAGASCAAPSVLRTGLCAGSALVKCCVPPHPAAAPAKHSKKSKSKATKGHIVVDHCAAVHGACADSATHTCSTPFRSGLCNGAASIQCCVGQVAAKTAPAAPAHPPAHEDKCAAIHGVCADSSDHTCSMPFRSGLCAGSASVKCCVGHLAAKAHPPAPAHPATHDDKCAAVHGTCADSSEHSCSTGFRSGLCSGSASNQCCIGKLTAKPATHGSTGPVAFETLRHCYPQGTVEEVKAHIGGAVNAAWITNTCAIRMSHTLNCAGRKIPNMGGESIKGALGQYIFRVKQLGPQVVRMFGKGLTFKAPTGRGVPLSSILGHKGIIMFDTQGAWDDATGHFDLFDGTAMVETEHSHPEVLKKYLGLSRSVTIWAMP